VRLEPTHVAQMFDYPENNLIGTNTPAYSAAASVTKRDLKKPALLARRVVGVFVRNKLVRFFVAVFEQRQSLQPPGVQRLGVPRFLPGEPPRLIDVQLWHRRSGRRQPAQRIRFGIRRGRFRKWPGRKLFRKPWIGSVPSYDVRHRTGTTRTRLGSF